MQRDNKYHANNGIEWYGNIIVGFGGFIRPRPILSHMVAHHSPHVPPLHHQTTNDDIKQTDDVIVHFPPKLPRVGAWLNSHLEFSKIQDDS